MYRRTETPSTFTYSCAHPTFFQSLASRIKMASVKSHQLVSSGAKSDILQLKKRDDVPAARRERMGVLSSGSASSAHLKARSPAVDAPQGPKMPLVQKKAHGGEVAHLEKRQTPGQEFAITLDNVAFSGTFGQTRELVATQVVSSSATEATTTTLVAPTADSAAGQLQKWCESYPNADLCRSSSSTKPAGPTSSPQTTLPSTSGAAPSSDPNDQQGTTKHLPQEKSKSNTGATVGAAIGCLLGGLLIGALFALWFLRRRHRNRVAAIQRAHESDLARYTDKGTEGMTVLPYKSERPNNKALETARQRIKTLEAERNAASAFGDTLDKLSERELVDKLSGVNRRLEQTAMALSRAADHGNDVTASRLQSSGNLPKSVPSFARAALSSIVANKKTASLDNVLKHVVNAVLVEHLCQPL
ncbi:hypothetical protein IE81DRAFT_247186 [Ceraceosorus guamensis]|uniref:Uncharacterized protein n=1 Tax=Ceraceosorus guamensis TaxID=1522189 RepID=A0A316VR31_9BASI|nr:hypothetical protein IE81DRAFT_247186 [Ceraceosorus guamensis]PWN39972.1 hypothetical protein IE81DRAFT_247186 [Ceraceosorus guamensis]